jgi:phage-related minor tail protein
VARPITITLLGDVSDLVDSLNEASEEVTGFGTKAAKIAAVAGGTIAAGLLGGLDEAMDQQQATANLAAQLGANPEQTKKLGEAAGKIYSDGYGESVEDANEALKNLWQQGLVPAGSTAAEMSKISESALSVATVLGEDVGPTANAVGQMLKTGMAKNAQEAFDILTRGAQVGGNKAEDLLDTFNEYSVQFKKVGLDGKDAMGLISQGLKGGARDADLVADAIKEFSIRSIDGSATTIAGFKAIGLNANDMREKIAAGGPAAKEALGETLDKLRAIQDPAKRAAAATELFGTQAEDLGSALYSLDVGTAVDSLGKVDGAAKAAGDQMSNTASNNIKIFERTLTQSVVNVLGSKVIPALTGFAEAMSPVVDNAKEVVQWVSANREPLIIVAGVITAVLLPALVQWGVTATISAASNVAAWLASTGSATTGAAAQVLASWAVVGGWIKQAAQAVLSGAITVGAWVLMGVEAMANAAVIAAAWLLSMGPIPIVIAAILALVALVILNWSTIKDWTEKVFTWIWNRIKDVFNLILFLFKNFTGPGLIISHWRDIMNFTNTAFTYVQTKAKAGLDAVVNFVKSLPGRITSAGSSLLSAGTNIGTRVIDGIKNGLSKLGGFASSLASVVSGATKGAMNHVIDLMNWAIPDKLGWGPVAISIPSNPIPKIRAMGGPASGLVKVGERGPEWLNLPKGSSVVPNHAGPSGGGVVVNVQSNADPYAIGREVSWALRTAR